jgi:hypothetical protein
MKTFDTATQAYMDAQAGVAAAGLVWIQSKDRATGAAASIGLWTGPQDASITIGGAARTYLGAGEILGLPDIETETGLAVREYRLQLSGIAPGVESAARQYDARFAPVEIHRALFNIDTGVLIAEPVRVVKGWCDRLSFEVGPIGGSAVAEMTVVSNARILTRTLATKKSDRSQRLRDDDRFRRYAEVTGQVGVWWGEKRR